MSPKFQESMRKLAPADAVSFHVLEAEHRGLPVFSVIATRRDGMPVAVNGYSNRRLAEELRDFLAS